MPKVTSRISTDRDRFNGQIRVLVRDRHEVAQVYVHWLTDEEAHALGAALLHGDRPAIASAPVVDSAEFAWNEVSWLGIDSFTRNYRDELDQAAVLLMQRALIDAWARRGRLVQLVDKAAFAAAPKLDTDPKDEVWHEVWQEAAQSIDIDALLTAADLIHEHTNYEE